MSLPNLLVIGAMKSGTTSLHHYLGLHPEIFMSRTKELDFFIEDRNWHRGEPWYAAQFPECAMVRGETSPRYSLHPVHPDVPRRIHRTIPDVKLLYIVREPVQRLVSHYMHDVIEGNESRPLEQILNEDPGNHYVLGSRYWLQLEQYRRYFPDDRILIIRHEDLRDNRLATLQAIFRFLRVEPRFRSGRMALERHRTSRKRRLAPVGRRLKDGVLGAGLRRAPVSIRGYLEWIAFYPFSRPVKRYDLRESVQRELESLLVHEQERVLGSMQVALAG